MVVWNVLVDPRPAWEIAIHTDLSVSTVHNVISRYNRFGPKAIERDEFGKRRRAHLSKEQEVEFLKPFLESASDGVLIHTDLRLVYHCGLRKPFPVDGTMRTNTVPDSLCS